MSLDPRNPEPTTPRQAEPADPWVARPADPWAPRPQPVQPDTPRQAEPVNPWTQPESSQSEPEHRAPAPQELAPQGPAHREPAPQEPGQQGQPGLPADQAQPGPLQTEFAPPGPAHRAPRDIRRQFGLVALVTALVAFVLQIAAWMSSAAGLLQVGTVLAWVAVAVSSAAFIGALVALIAGWRRLAAAGALLVSLIANPLVVAAALSAGQAFTPY